MNSSERSQPLRDPQQIILIMLNRFWSLSKKPFTPLFLKDSIKQEGNTSLFYIVFQVLRRYFCEKLEDTATSSFISCFVTATVHKVLTTDSLVFFSEHISKAAVLAQASVITCTFSLYYFIFQRIIWKAISHYFLWFHYWILKE